MKQKIIFFRIAWMKHYKGKTKDDIPYGGGSYIAENENGGEVRNFLPADKKLFGFVRPQKGNSIHLEKIGADRDDKSTDNVIVVFFARDPFRGGEFIIGWYENATVFRYPQKRAIHSTANPKDATLIPANARSVSMPANGPGQSNVWYGNPRFISKVLNYIENYDEAKVRKTINRKSTQAWQPDLEKRKQVENAAMAAVEAYYYENGFNDVQYVHEEKLGWDMEAVYGKQKLLVEVKGLSGNLNSVELTANEYKQAKFNKRVFRLCIVTDALNKKRLRVYEFRYTGIKGIWKTPDNIILETKEVTSARLINNSF